jgi:hypothetical protein
VKKKDPVLWVVVDSDGTLYFPHIYRSNAEASRAMENMTRTFGNRAPFRVVKYVPAPKPNRKRKA